MGGVWPQFSKEGSMEVRRVPGVQSEILDRFGLWIFHWMENVHWGPPQKRSKIYYRGVRFYCISHLIDGDGVYMQKDGRLVTNLVPGDAVIVTPQDGYYLGGNKQAYTEDFISFCGPVADQLFQGGLLSDGVFHMGSVRRLLPIIEKLQQPTFQNQIEAGIELLRLFSDLHFKNVRSDNSEGDPIIKALLDQIVHDCRHPWTVKGMAEFCSLSINHFRTRFKECTGMLPKQYLDWVRMNEAAQFLATSPVKLDELAMRYHYSDAFHFSRSFKRVMGDSPKAFRHV